MEAFWLSLGMIFIAELGDKTQLVAMTLATRYNTRIVLWGIFLATLAVHVFSAGIGWCMGGFLPTDWIKLLAGVAFIGFGFWTLRGDSLDEEEGEKRRAVSPFWLVFITFFLAELGDKTMLTTVTLAATHDVIPVWVGSTLGMVCSDGLAILVGKKLGTKLPEGVIKIGAAFIFIGFGLFSGFQGGRNLPVYAWAISLCLIIFMAFFFFRKKNVKEAVTNKAA
ncbi:MAG TPA: TMEM165/GDT1 family protein [Bacillota bacterium]|nr:TMEM165/GDT1 family protein [Bacillota bacterium]